MDIVYPELPTQIYRDELLDAIRSLGFEPNSVRELHIQNRGLEVTCMLRNERGHPFAAGDEVSTVTLRLPITDRALMKDEDAA